MTDIQKLIEKVGGSSAFAKRFAIGLRTVQYWKCGKQAPPVWVVKLFKLMLDKCE